MSELDSRERKKMTGIETGLDISIKRVELTLNMHKMIREETTAYYDMMISIVNSTDKSDSQQGSRVWLISIS